MLQDAKFSGGILSGSFNPVHRGHIELANKASQILDREIAFEISAANVDKPPLESAEIQERTTQFKGKANVLVSMAPLFSQKSALYPNSSFVIGYDTARRLVDPKYYGNNKKVLFAHLEQDFFENVAKKKTEQPFTSTEKRFPLISVATHCKPISFPIPIRVTKNRENFFIFDLATTSPDQTALQKINIRFETAFYRAQKKRSPTSDKRFPLIRIIKRLFCV